MNNIQKAFLLVIIIISIVIKLPYVSEPFIYPHDDNGALFSQAARNDIRFGFCITKGGMLLSPAKPDIQKKDYYINHPPLLPIILSFIFRIFGESELNARLLSLCFSVIGLYYFFKIVYNYFGYTEAIFSLIFASVVPISAFYGKMLNFEVFIFAIAMIVMYFFLKSQVSPLKSFFIELGLLSIISALIDFGFAFFVIGMLFLIKDRADFKKWLVIFISMFIGYLIYIIHIAILQGTEVYRHLLISFLQRSSIIDSEIMPKSLYKFLLQQFILFFPYYNFTIVGSLLFLSGFFLLKRYNKRIIIALLCSGILNIFIFRNAAFIHEYWQFYLLPGVSLIVGICLAELYKKMRLIPYVLCLLLFYQSLSILQNIYRDSHKFDEAIKISKILKEKIPEDGVVCINKKFSKIHHIPFYADRRVVYEMKELDKYTKNIFLLLIDNNEIFIKKLK
ncbi:MAG: glycosyltransferase family 39 protein [Candidatus Hydrogenedentota bacterium]